MFESVKKQTKRSAKGFTLIELLVVVVIVGILAAVALPNFLSQSGKARLTESDAAFDAIKSGQEVAINERGAYQTVGDIGTAPTAQPANNLLPGSQANIVTTSGAFAAYQTGLQINVDALNKGWLIATEAITVASAPSYQIASDGSGANVNLHAFFQKSFNAPIARDIDATQ
jgi:type IV pilus assembly protein PilA